MQKVSFRDLIHMEKLQKIQNEFCMVTGVAAYCVDEDGNAITSISGTEEQQKKLQQNEYRELASAMLERVEAGSLEDQAVEEVETVDERIAAIAVRVENTTVIYWVVLDCSHRTEVELYHVLDLLHDTSMALFADRVSCISAEEETKRSRYAEQEMSKNLHTIAATTEIVQLLDSDEQIELVMDKWLGILAKYLQVDTAQLYQLGADGEFMDVICEWCAPGVISFFDKTSRIQTYDFLRADKPLVISAGSVDVADRKEISDLGISAVMIFPVVNQEDGRNLILSLVHREQKHMWSMTEIKFSADAVKVLQSILTRRVQKDILANSYASMEAVLDNVGWSIYVKDKATGEMLFANRRLQNIFAKELEENTFTELLEEGVDDTHDGRVCEVFHASRDKYYDLIHKEISWVGGQKAILYSLYDITEKKLYQKKIEQQAYTDFLTGLYNRMSCEKDLAKHIDEAKRIGVQGALLYMDLDDFKHINDGLGHRYGDALLRSISIELQRVEGIEHTCYRMGGDEFVIVIPPSSFKRFEGIIKDIKDIFGRPWFLKDTDYYCTMSMGVVTYPDDGETVSELIKNADIAMYEAKKTGKNRVASYSPGEKATSGRRLDLEKNMREATAAGYEEFEVYYQPIIRMQDGEAVCGGAEALVRWNSQKLGFLPPSEFIPLAEYLGLINPIGDYVLREACHHCKQWNDNGHPDYKVNVNLSVVQLLQPDIVESIEKILKESELNPRNLTLEVTESLAINDMERMQEVLNNIKALGVTLALDDFGTGYSSLNHIREIPVDVIKVDQSFVKGLTADEYSQAFIKLVAELAQTIGMSICVEGVESVEQYQAIKGMQVKYIQGYHFDRPLPCNEFEEKYVSGVAKK